MFANQTFLDGALYATRAAGRYALPADRQAELPILLYWQRDDVPSFIPTEVCKHPVSAELNHARWVVKCECGAAQFASKTDHRFFCVQCLNELDKGQWRPVEWPVDVEGIERLMRPRYSENVNWLPGEKVSQLVAENNAMGIVVET